MPVPGGRCSGLRLARLRAVCAILRLALELLQRNDDVDIVLLALVIPLDQYLAGLEFARIIGLETHVPGRARVVTRPAEGVVRDRRIRDQWFRGCCPFVRGRVDPKRCALTVLRTSAVFGIGDVRIVCRSSRGLRARGGTVVIDGDRVRTSPAPGEDHSEVPRFVDADSSVTVAAHCTACETSQEPAHHRNPHPSTHVLTLWAASDLVRTAIRTRDVLAMRSLCTARQPGTAISGS